MRADEAEPLVVVDADRVVLGLVKPEALRGNPESRIEQVMDPGPVTFRPNLRVGETKAASRFKFRVRAIVMDKERIYGEELRRSKDSFYRYAIKMVLQHSFGKIRAARLRIDRHGDREFRRELRSYLSREIKPRQADLPVVQKLKIMDSKRDVLIQLADRWRAH